MKTAKEFIEKLTNDKAFTKEINDAVQAKKDANAPDYADAIVAIAAERGYEVTVEQVRKLRAAQSESVSAEELGKVAGGTACAELSGDEQAAIEAFEALLKQIKESAC